MRKIGNKKPSPITEIIRRDSPKYTSKYGRHCKRNFSTGNLLKKKPTIARYPRVRKDSRKMPEEKWDEIQKLYHAGWKINWISKKVGIDWHSVKIAVDDRYAFKRR